MLFPEAISSMRGGMAVFLGLASLGCDSGFRVPPPRETAPASLTATDEQLQISSTAQTTATTTAQSTPNVAFNLVSNHATTLAISGQQGEQFMLLASVTPPSSLEPPIAGAPLLVNTESAAILFRGVLPPSGVHQIRFSVPASRVGPERIYMQALLTEPRSQAKRLTNGAALAVREDPFQPVALGVVSSHPSAVTGGGLLITDETGWSAFWQQHAVGTTEPTVDFAALSVVAVFAAQGTAAGVEVTGWRLGAGGAQLEVDVTEFQPGAGCSVQTVVLQPHYFAALPAVAAGTPVVLNTTTVVIDCP